MQRTIGNYVGFRADNARHEAGQRARATRRRGRGYPHLEPRAPNSSQRPSVALRWLVAKAHENKKHRLALQLLNASALAWSRRTVAPRLPAILLAFTTIAWQGVGKRRKSQRASAILQNLCVGHKTKGTMTAHICCHIYCQR